MLKVKKFVFNPFSENTYVINDHLNNAIIIDPGCYYSHEEKEIESYIELNNLKVNSILHTHSHLDHMFGTSFLANKYNVGVLTHEEDESTYNAFEKVCATYGVPIKSCEPVEISFFDVNDGFYLGDNYLEIRYVPGHAPGHVVFYSAENNFIINGDCLFQGSIGRTDLPGGNHQQLISAIKSQLFSLPTNTLVYCGHGPETTIGDEINNNPFLKD